LNLINCFQVPKIRKGRRRAKEKEGLN